MRALLIVELAHEGRDQLKQQRRCAREHGYPFKCETPSTHRRVFSKAMLGRPIQFFLLRMEQFWVLVLGTKIGTSFGTGNRQLLKASANPRPPRGSKNDTKIGYQKNGP